MSNSNQLYANGRIAVLSTKLLSADKLLRIADSNSLVEALKVLSESGYAGGLNVAPEMYEQVLRAELDESMRVVKELCFDRFAVSYMLAQFDYLNAKTLMKGKYMRQDYTEYCFDEATYAPKSMQEAFVHDDYSIITDNMAHACDAIDTEFASGNRSPQTIDIVLDKAMFADMHSFAKKSSLPLIRKLFDWQVNTLNLMLIYRFKRAGLSKDAYSGSIVQGGSIKATTLLKLWNTDAVSLDLVEPYRSFYALCSGNVTSLVLAEKRVQTRRNELIAEYADLLTIQPAVEYFYKKIDETEKVRHLLVDVKNGVDKEKIKDKLK